MSVNKKKRNIKMVTNLLKVQKKVDNFSQTFFFLKSNNKTNKQEENRSLNLKKNLMDTLHRKVFKANL